MIYSELPKTLTRDATNSVWAFLALSHTDDAGNRYISLTVLEFRGKIRTRRVVDRYLLERVEAELTRDGVAFVCSKVHHSGDEDTVRGRESSKRVGEVYRCEVGEVSRCSCTAGNTEDARSQMGETAHCVHHLIICELVADGTLVDDYPVGPSNRAGADSGVGTETPAGERWWAEAVGGRLEPETADW